MYSIFIFSYPCNIVQVFIKSELKVGVIYVKEGQYLEEEILDNNDNSHLFQEFLQILGEKVRLKGNSGYIHIIVVMTAIGLSFQNSRILEVVINYKSNQSKP